MTRSSSSKLVQKHPQRVMRAFDVRDHPAVGTVDDDEVQRHGPAVIGKADGDVGLVELLAQDRGRNRAQFPGRALHQKVIGLVPRGGPCGAQAWIEELARGLTVARQPLESSAVPLP